MIVFNYTGWQAKEPLIKSRMVAIHAQLNQGFLKQTQEIPSTCFCAIVLAASKKCQQINAVAESLM